MALFQAVVELRGRGLDVNLAAFFVYHNLKQRNLGKPDLFIDSTAILVVGPAASIRTVFDANSVLQSAVAETDINYYARLTAVANTDINHRPKGWEKMQNPQYDPIKKNVVVSYVPIDVPNIQNGAGCILSALSLIHI